MASNRRGKKSKKKAKKKEKRLKKISFGFIDNEGVSVRFERCGAELVFYIDNELRYRQVTIKQMSARKRWIIFRGQSVKEKSLTASSQVVCEVREEEWDHVVPRVENLRHWNGPMIVGSWAEFQKKPVMTTAFDSKTSMWSLQDPAGGAPFKSKSAQFSLLRSCLPHNCIPRDDTEFVAFVQTEKEGMGVEAKQDIGMGKEVIRDRAFLFLKWDLFEDTNTEKIAKIANLFHTLRKGEPKIWEYLQNTMSDSGKETVDSHMSLGKALQETLSGAIEEYKDPSFLTTFARAYSQICSNAYQVQSNNAIAALFPRITAFNHSSKPNCTLNMNITPTGFACTVMAKKSISAGETLTINHSPRLLKPTTPRKGETSI